MASATSSKADAKRIRTTLKGLTAAGELALPKKQNSKRINAGFGQPRLNKLAGRNNRDAIAAVDCELHYASDRTLQQRSDQHPANGYPNRRECTPQQRSLNRGPKATSEGRMLVGFKSHLFPMDWAGERPPCLVSGSVGSCKTYLSSTKTVPQAVSMPAITSPRTRSII
jgi:hypothetical protein